jgi:hypothetical protein
MNLLPSGTLEPCFEATDEIRLELLFANGATLWVSGASVHVHHTGESRFIERFAC